MVLSDRDIKKAIGERRLVIKPEVDFATQLGSCLIDLRLGNTFRVFNHSSIAVIDPRDGQLMDKVTTVIKVNTNEAFILHPGEFVLAVTREYIEVPDDLTGRLEGRSSIGRLGVVVHSTAANIECGFRGHITLELANMGPIPVKLYPDMRICSISFEQLSSPAETPYYRKHNAKYLGQKDPGISRISEEVAA